MQNAITFETNDCVVSEANSRGSDVNVFKTSDIPSMPSMPTTTTSTHHHNHNHQGVTSAHNLSAQQLQQLLNSASNNCQKNNNNSNNSNNSLNTTCSSPKLNLMAELFESEEEDDDNSEVESFTLDEEPVVDTSRFLLSAQTDDNKLVSGINFAEPPEIDPESRANLEALLDADKHLIDPDVLRRIASSFAVSDVHCALDEAAAAIAKMRINDSQLTCTPLSTANPLSKSNPTEELTTDVESSSRILEDRCGVNEVTEDGESFLSFACSSGHYELAKQLLVARANVEDRGLKDTTPLMEASSAGHLKIVELLIDNNAEVNAQTSQGNTPLMYACAGGHEEVVKLLLKNGANVEEHNENGHTPLMEAASAGHVGVAAILVEHGASINTHSNEFKESALTLACYKGHLEMVRFLLEAGADQEHKTDEMHTALMEASMDGHVEVARLLLDSGAQVNMPADSFESPLTLAACGGHVELAMLLLERGANIEEVNDEGYTPLMEAAREGHEEMVALLLSQGADINAQTEETQETALTLACCGGFLDVADFLIKAGADIEAGANTPLMEAAQEGHLDLVRHLINSGANVNATTSSGDTALMYSCENGHTDVAELLLQSGANLEHEAEGGRTSLMKACRAGHLCTVQFLINRGANVNKMTANNDHTPLSLACAGGHLAVVELLLANSADPTHRLKDSSTMLIEAAKGGHTTVVQLLIDYPTNLMASSPPNLSHMASSDAEPTPRVPRHGLQAEDTCNRSHSSISSSIQSKIITKSNSKKNISKENNLNTNSTNTTTNKTPETVDSYVPFSKGRTTNKVLERSLSDSGASFMAPTNLGLTESTTFSSIDALKEAERLEARINDMIRRTDELDPAKEEQIRQKQQILEELQRVEREYQAHWQQQLIQCYQAGLSCSPSLSQMSANIPIESTDISTNVSPQGIPLCLEVSSNVQKPETAFQMPSHVNQSHIFQTTPTSVSTDLSSINSSIISTQTSFPNTISAATNTSISLSTPPANRRFRSNSKIKCLSSKQHSHQTNVNPKTTSHSNTEEVEKINFKNTINLEHLDPNNANPSGVNQQTQSLLQQQQMILSELAQNFSARPETLQFLQAAASNMKIDPSIPFLLPRLFEANTLSQTPVIQSQTQSASQSVPQTTQSTTSSTHSLTSSHENAKKSLQTISKTNKVNKSLKLSNAISGAQPLIQTSVATTQPMTTSAQPMSNQTTQTTLIQTLTTDQLMLLKTQFAASTATQTDSPSALQQFADSTAAPTVISQTPNFCPTNSGLYSMGAPAFPVSLTLSPVTISPATTTTSNNRSIISTIIPYPVDVEDSNIQSIVSVANSSAQQMSTVLTTTTTTDINPSKIASFGNLSSMVTNPMSSSPNFDVSTPVITTAQASQTVNTGLSSLATHFMSNPIPYSLDTLSTNANESEPIITTNNISIPTQSTTSTTPPTSIRIPSPPPWYPPVDVDSQTDSNHDTALTLACAGGHEELVSLLLNRGAEMEHRDKKGFTPLMLAATAGHSNVVEIMLNNGADMEAQSERTKDTALSLACSSGRYEVVEILLSRGANKEHRNVSDYTPLSLAASGGYVNIIKLLLSHGAEINSRTGSKLGISPLMLAAMNGHAATVRLLLDMGSDINAQIETNRNTALTLACFQGRCEVVGLLLDRKANVEHRAKTGLTPLMEAASGGYVEVGRVLLDKGADVNAPPVPSSRDTALTIAADKGHYRFVELLLSRGAAVDVKNKKGNSPLWLACNGGHLDVIQLLVNAGCDIDSQDNRKVSCLMSSFRKGHVKAVKWMVKHVNQFPSDQEINRFIALINDKELLKKTNQCSEILRQAKERQAAEANKNATILLEEIDLELKREENRKAAAARRRERKRQKKKEKQELLVKVTKTLTADEKDKKMSNKSKNRLTEEEYEDNEDEEEDDDEIEESNDEEDEEEVPEVNPIRVSAVQPKESKNKIIQSTKGTVDEKVKPIPIPKEAEKQRKASNGSNQTIQTNPKKSLNPINVKTKKKDNLMASDVVITAEKNSLKSNNNSINTTSASTHHMIVYKSGAERLHNTSNRSSTDIFSELSVEMPKELNGNSLSASTNRSPNHFTPTAAKSAASFVASSNNHLTQSGQMKKGSKREEGWKEVVRKSKKVVVPSNAISRVIGRGGCNINTIREISGAHIEVEKQKGQGDRMVIIKGSADATRHAQQLIAALSKETEKDLSEIIKSLGLSRPTSVSSDEFPNRNPCKSQSTAVMASTSRHQTITSNVLKSSSMNSVCNSSLPSNVSTYTNRSSLLVRTSAPVAQSSPFGNAWNTRSSSSTRMPSISTTNANSTANATKSTVSYTMAVAAKGKNTKTTSVSTIVPAVPKTIASSDMKGQTATMTSQLRPMGAPQGLQPFNQMFTGARVPVPMNNMSGAKNTSYLPSTKQPFNSIPTITTVHSMTTTTTSSMSCESEPKSAESSGTTPEYTPFNNLFSKVAQQSVWGQKDYKPNFASVAASGLTSIASSNASHTNTLATSSGLQQNQSKEQSIDASKAPGYRGNLHMSPSNTSIPSTPSSSSGTSSLGPIGSGHARSAPCTPPLMGSQGPLTPSNSGKMSTPPLSQTPTPPPHHSMAIQNRSVTDPQNSVFSMGNDAKASAMSGSHSPSHTISTASITSSSPMVTSYQPLMQTNVINSSNLQPIVSTPIKSQSYGMSSAMNVPQRHSFVTNTTYSPNNCLTSVGPLQTGNEQNPSVYGVNSNNGVQSNLNPNAPDFSARVSVMQSSQQMNGPSINVQNRMTSNTASNVTPNPTIVLQDQMRAAILAASANLQLQTLQRQQAERLQMAANSGLHLANDFGTNTPPPSPETLRLLHTAINSIPTANSAHGLQHFGLPVMPAQNYMTQPIHQRMTQTLVNSMNQKEMESNADYEERKLPRPIGTERAQHRKNPTPVFSHNINSMSSMNANNDTTPVGMWPFGCEVVPNDVNEWQLQAQQQQLVNQSMHSNMTADNPIPNMNQNQFTSVEDISHFESNPYSMSVGSHVSNPLNYSPSAMSVMGMNGVPPHLSTTLYQQSISSNSAINTTQDSDYWNTKLTVNANLGNGMSGNQSMNTEQKINWNHWNQQT